MTRRAQTPRTAGVWSPRLLHPLRIHLLILVLAVVGVQVSTGERSHSAEAANRAQAPMGSALSSDTELAGFIGNPVAEVPLTGLSATRERPLFSPSRHPAFPPPPPPAAPRTQRTAPPPSPVQSPSVALFGIVVDAQGSRAFIATQTTDPIIGVRTGDDVSGWTVTAITDRSLVLSRADMTATFTLFSPENASRIARFDSVPGHEIPPPVAVEGRRRVRIR